MMYDSSCSSRLQQRKKIWTSPKGQDKGPGEIAALSTPPEDSEIAPTVSMTRWRLGTDTFMTNEKRKGKTKEKKQRK
jgi:hypothetical protein